MNLILSILHILGQHFADLINFFRLMTAQIIGILVGLGRYVPVKQYLNFAMGRDCQHLVLHTYCIYYVTASVFRHVASVYTVQPPAPCC